MHVRRWSRWGAWAAAVMLLLPQRADACPFCQATQATFAQEFEQSAVVVIAEQVDPVAPAADGAAEGAPNRPLDLSDVKKAKFRIREFLKGGERLPGTTQIEVLYFGAKPAGTPFLIMGIEGKITEENASPVKLRDIRERDDPNKAPAPKPKPTTALVPDDLNWSNPITLTPHTAAYFRKLVKLPADPAERLKFFIDYFEDPEDLVSTDAYNEFAISKYETIQQIKDAYPREKLLAWIKNPQIFPSHRRQYLSLLGVCGKPEDVAMLEEMIRNVSSSEATRQALDALIACYMKLAGPNSIDLVERQFLANKNAPFSETYMAVMAIRFHGEQEKIVPKERLLKGLRHVLQRAELADLVIPDLTRWEDWGALEELVTLFKTADKKTTWVRAPIFNYLRVCPLPEAKKHLEELAKLDPETYKWAAVYGAFRPGQNPATVPAGEKTDASGTAAPAATKPAAPPSGEARTFDPGPDPRFFPRGSRVAAEAAPPAPNGLWGDFRENVRRGFDWRLGGMLLGVAGLYLIRRSLPRPA